jgi:T5SS/PEP-CTERM-associated repeat protein
MKTKRFTTCVVVVVAMLPATVAHATKFWKNSVVNGNWSTGNNWSAVSAAGADNGGVPVGGEAVNIAHSDGTARTVTLDVSTPSLGVVGIDLTGAGVAADTLSITSNNNLTAVTLDVGGYNGTAFTSGRGAVVQSAGTTTVSANGDLILGVGSGSTGTYTLSGGALVANESEVVAFNGTGTFNHSGGTNTINANANGAFFVGFNAGSAGTYNLSGTGALLSNESEYIGYSSNNSYFNQTGGTNTITTGNNLYLGYNSGSAGIYTLSGGTLTVGNDAIVGNSGTGSLWVNSGTTAYVTNNLSINGASVVNINGGTLRFNTISGIDRVNYFSGTVQLGDFFRDLTSDTVITSLFGSSPVIPSGKGLAVEGSSSFGSGDTVAVDGGSLTIDGNFSIGAFSFGALNITNGGTVATGGLSSIALGSGGAASVSISGVGSTWYANSNLNVGDDGLGTLTIQNQALVFVGQSLGIDNIFGAVNLNGGILRFNGSSGTHRINFTSGTIQLAGNRSIGSDAAIVDLFGGAPTLTSGKGLTVEGTATLLTTVTLDGGTLSANQLANGYNLRLQHGTLNLANQAVTIGSGGLLGSTLDLALDMTVNVTLGVTNQGLVTGDGQIGGTFANAAAGQLRAEPGRSLKLTGANNSNAGQINLFGGQLEFTQNLTNNAGAFISGNGTLITSALVNHGTMNFSGAANVVGDVTNSATGKVISSGGGPTTFYDDVVNNGEIRTSTNGFTVFFGAVSGSGTFTGTGTVNFEGDLSPGSSPAAVNFAGDVAFGADAALQIEIGGITAGSQHDKLSIAGDLAFDGALEVALINGFTPTAGQSFNILDWLGTRTGTFSSLELPALTGLAWDTSQLYTDGVLAVAAAGLPGDFNHDNSVDAADYIAWRKGVGVASTPENYNLWQENFARTNLPGGGASVVNESLYAGVPEPASVALLLAAVGILVIPRCLVAAKNCR